MKTVGFGAAILACSAAVLLLSSCGVGSPTGSGVPRALGSDGYSRPSHERSWMKPGTSGQDLLYVTGYSDGGFVDVYAYPQGEKVGSITGLIAPPGACVDAAGDVFVTDLAPGSKSGVVYEYAHGGTTPIATLSDPAVARGCAVDPRTGNLAVSGGIDDRGAIAIYTSAEGTPNMYYGPKSLGFLYCVYDNQSKLYVTDYMNESGTEVYGLARLLRGGRRIDQLSVDKPIRGFPTLPPSALWDGKHVVVSSAGSRPEGKVSLYRLAFSGKNARVVGTTTLNHGRRLYIVGQTWLFDGMIFSSTFRHYYSHISWWRYPPGRNPTGISRRVFVEPTEPLGLTLSPAQSR
jgi:hypothetical protein